MANKTRLYQKSLSASQTSGLFNQ